MLRNETDIDEFRGFVVECEPRLRQALSATLGTQAGKDATADALSYAWEHWERIRPMKHRVGYVFVVGRDQARKSFRRKRPVFLRVDASRLPWIEPSLPIEDRVSGYLPTMPLGNSLVSFGEDSTWVGTVAFD